jgi:hypothetical protein
MHSTLTFCVHLHAGVLAAKPIVASRRQFAPILIGAGQKIRELTVVAISPVRTANAGGGDFHSESRVIRPDYDRYGRHILQSVSSVGLGFIISAKYLLPITVASLVLAVAGLAFKAKHRHGYGPLMLGFLAAVGVLIGKFAWESNPTMYVTVGLLVIASLWNAWPHRITAASACCAEKLNQL